jgi:hypothetical protein
MVMRGPISVLGGVFAVVGLLFIGQGTNVIHGSSMSGHGSYAVLGGVLLVVGVGLLAWATRVRGGRTS